MAFTLCLFRPSTHPSSCSPPSRLLLVFSSFLAGYETKRFDVILFSPVFVFLQTLDLFILLRSFVKTVVLSRHDHAWNHCARY